MTWFMICFLTGLPILMFALFKLDRKQSAGRDSFRKTIEDDRQKLASTFSVGEVVILNTELGGRVNDLYLPKGEIGVVHKITHHGAIAVRFDAFYASLDPKLLDKQIHEVHHGAD